jgi:GT2 family glycosyltransferase
VVDNGSGDGVGEMVKDKYPWVHFIDNQKNLGFTHPMNQALQIAAGQFLLLLNPDTLVQLGALDTLVQFLRDHSEAGICGPKVLNRDGTMQKQCRRGDSRPLAAISYMTGLYRLFPSSRFFGGYLLNYLDENEVNEVGGVSGSCMLIRREVINAIGYLDERYFAYQEDADYCYAARKSGWKVYYVPTAQIIHFGGQGGSRVDPYRSVLEWHRSYWLYYRKNFAREYFFLFNWIYYGLILLKLAVSLAVNFFRRDKFAGPSR